MNKKNEEQSKPIPVVGGFILNKRNQILIIQSYKWGGYSSVPGGRIELGESIEEALKREMKEELNLTVKVEKLLCVLDAIFPKEFFKHKHMIFLNHLCHTTNESDLKIDQDEIQSYRWIDLKKVLKENLEPCSRFTIEKHIIPLFRS